MIERIFKTYDIRATYPDQLNEESAWKVGYATALYFQRDRQHLPNSARTRLEDTLVMGRDMRPHSPSLAQSLADGIRASGMNVIDLGMVDASLLNFAVNHLDCVGGIYVTASHYPLTYNGFKLIGPRGRIIGSATGLEDIKRIAGTLRVGKTGLQGKIESRDIWSAYRRHVLRFLNLPRPITIAVDAANGMAGWMIPAVFDHLPNLQISPLLYETTGSFAHEPNPVVPENLQLLREKVLAEKPDLAVSFDGDADRCVFMDQQGQMIPPDLLLTLLAHDYLARPENHGATVVYDLRCSRVVPEEITKAGGKPHRERVGHTHIQKAMADTNAIFGGELTGHYYFRDNYNADSGAIAFARVLSLVAGQALPVGKLLSPLRRYCQSGEISFMVDDKDTCIRDLADKHRKAQIDYLDGITVDYGDWWFNVRKSSTQNMLRLNLECQDPSIMADHLAELTAFLGQPVTGL